MFHDFDSSNRTSRTPQPQPLPSMNTEYQLEHYKHCSMSTNVIHDMMTRFVKLLGIVSFCYWNCYNNWPMSLQPIMILTMTFVKMTDHHTFVGRSTRTLFASSSICICRRLTVAVAVAVVVAATIHSSPTLWNMKHMPPHRQRHRLQQQRQSASLLLQYTFTTAQCEHGYFLPDENSSHPIFLTNNDDTDVSSTKFYMVTMSTPTTELTPPPTATRAVTTPEYNTSCCAPMIGVIPTFVANSSVSYDDTTVPCPR